MLPVFGRWCTCYAVHFTAVCSTFDTTARINAARLSAVGVGVMSPILLLLVQFLTLRLGYMLPVIRRWGRRYAAPFTAVGSAFNTEARVDAVRFSAVGEGVMLPFLLLLVPPLTLRLG